MHFAMLQCKQKGSAHIFALVGVLIVILVVGEVYYFSRTKTAKTPQASQVKQVATVVSNLQIPKISSVEQSQFEDYINEGLGIGFRISKEFITKTDSEEEFDKRGNGTYRKNFLGYAGYEPGKVLGAVVVLDKEAKYGTNPFSVWVFENPNELSINSWFDKYWYYPFIWGVFDSTSKGHIVMDQEATISGKSARYKIVSYQPGKPKFVYIAKGQEMYLLRVIGEEGERILANFKFLF